MTETTPIFDEIHQFMGGIAKGLRDLGPAINQFSISIEAASIEWERANAEWRRKKDQLNKQKAACLHGRISLRITWGVSMKCPQCYSDQVYVGSERLWCLLCGWKQWRIGKKPRVRFKNG